MKETNNAFRVFVDTNVLISAVRSPESISGRLIQILMQEHHLVLCTHSITEASQVIAARFPEKLSSGSELQSSDFVD